MIRHTRDGKNGSGGSEDLDISDRERQLGGTTDSRLDTHPLILVLDVSKEKGT